MLNHDLGDRNRWPLLTLKQAPRHNRLSRLLPCGSLEQKQSDLACAVFLKRSRAHRSKLLKPTQPQKRADGTGAGRARRRGSFLRLANIRSH